MELDTPFAPEKVFGKVGVIMLRLQAPKPFCFLEI